MPDGDLAIILERAADLLLEKTKKQRFAQTARPRASKSLAAKARAAELGANQGRASAAPANEQKADKPGATDAPDVRSEKTHSRYIPRAVVREVHARDGEQCTFVSSDGRRCPERGFLELHHHDTPYAHGGPATTANLRTMCHTHNALLAERDFGRAFIQSKLLHARLRKRDGANGLEGGNVG